MSSMTVGVKRKFWPRIRLLRELRPSCSDVRGSAAVSSSNCINLSSQNELLLGRLEIVVVPQLLAGDDLAHVRYATRRFEAVHAQFAGEPINVESRHFAVHRIDAEGIDIAADIDDAVVH